MFKLRVILSSVLVLLFLGILKPQFAQEPSANGQIPEEVQHRRAILIGLMRTINTAEVGERSKYGSYSSWEILLTHNPEYFNQWLSKFYAEDITARFADAPEVLPGYSLRLSVHADGQGY